MVQVEILDGILEGERVINEYGGSFYSFRGIPYAKPPIGELRFMAPQPVEPWQGVRNAKEEGPVCIQYDSYITNQYCGQEDCLYLNVYSPDLKPNQSLPVMVWIHGGGFTCGSGNFYEPEFLIKKDVVLVTFNYRLEVLGFLCLNTEEIPGNAGMKDQVAALRWVQKNIKYFGGDPSNVTIFGESAGAGSVSYHLVSPMSVGLFKRAILQSGAITNAWSRCERPRDRALNLARKLGFYSENDIELAAFFKSVPVESLVKINLPVTLAENFETKLNVWFSIVNEKKFENCERFFFEDELQNKMPEIHKNIEIIIGYTEHEGILALNAGFNLDEIIEQSNNFADYFVPSSIRYKASLHDQLDLGNRIKKYYFKDDIVSMKNIKQLLNYFSANFFVYGIIALARAIAKSNQNKLYLYKFTCKTKRNIFAEKLGTLNFLGTDETFVCHGDDIAYLFPLSIISEKVNENSIEQDTIETVTNLWTNFAKYGSPTPNNDTGVEWRPFTIEEQDYLNIGNTLAKENHPERDEVLFWDTIYNRFFPHYTEFE
ncbi:unnamed protein product, partial [Brenthis ino]